MRTWVSAAAVAAAAGVMVGWAGHAVLSPSPERPAASFTLVRVAMGEISSSITLSSTAVWSRRPVGTNLAAGTVTEVLDVPHGGAAAGTPLYSVNLRPVSVAEGAVPAFRPLAQGATGPDVAQLQRMLYALGDQSMEDADGRFEASTARAVGRWQRSIGLPGDGTVALGDLIFVDVALPATLLVDQAVQRGSTIVGGEPAVTALDNFPVFTIVVTDAQAALIPDGTKVDLEGPGGAIWPATVNSRQLDQATGQVRLDLLGVTTPNVCQDACDSVPTSGESLIPAQVSLVDPLSGATLPTSAIVTRSNGTTAVVGEDGVLHDVRVRGVARGVSVIEGVPIGTQVRTPVSSP